MRDDEPSLPLGEPPKTVSWRDRIEVHPDADRFPMMPEADLRALGEDIVRRGLDHQIVFDSEHRLVDGRNRLAALEAVGALRFDKLTGLPLYRDLKGREIGVRYYNLGRNPRTDPKPRDLIRSANILRRHLSVDEKMKFAAELLKARPELSNRQLAEQVKLSHPKIGKIRKGLEEAGMVETVTTVVGKDGVAQPARKPRKPKPSDPPAGSQPAKSDKAPPLSPEEAIEAGRRAGEQLCELAARRLEADATSVNYERQHDHLLHMISAAKPDSWQERERADFAHAVIAELGFGIDDLQRPAASKEACTVEYPDGSFHDFPNPEIKAVYDAYQKVKPKDRRFCLDHIDAVSMKELRAEHKQGVRYGAAHEWRTEWLLAHFGVSVTWPELDIWVGGCGDNNYRVTPPAIEPTTKCAVKSRDQRIRLALDYIAKLDLGLDDLQPVAGGA